jgi:formate-dependent phosphoribosylglycinamide formyltransferase (GAR transformylase)
MYSRLPTMFPQTLFRRHVELPVVFLTDDEALADVLEHLHPSFAVANANGIEITGDAINVDGLVPEVRTTVRAYMHRERERVLMHSKGITPEVMRRANYLAKVAERTLATQERF